MRYLTLAVLIGAAFSWTGCSITESRRALRVDPIGMDVPQAPPGDLMKIALGRVRDRSSYLKGIFTDKDNRLGNQGRDILKTHLSTTGRFAVMDREHLDEAAFESELSGVSQDLAGAEFLVTGAVTEFGRRVTGTKALGGLLGKSKTQTAYAKVSISLLDVRTSRVVHTVQGAGEVELSNSEVLGFGTRAGYDSHHQWQ